MVLAEPTELRHKEIDSYLNHCESGVLALARNNEPYTTPISFGYDSKQRQFYIRLVETKDSNKLDFLHATPEARLVIYQNNGPEYTRVIVSGDLEELTPTDLTVELIERFGEVKRPLFEMWNDEVKDLDIQLYKLDPTEISGRRVTVDRDKKPPCEH